MESKKKYLTIQILGKNGLRLAAFDNSENRDKNKQAPHFKGDGVAIWVNERKDKVEEEEIL